MGMDPVELRRKNMLRRDEMPYFNPNGMPYDHVAPVETFEQAVKILDHEGFRKEQAEALAQGRYLGLGFSAYIEPTAAATGNFGTEGAPSASSRPARSTSTSTAARAATASRPLSSS